MAKTSEETVRLHVYLARCGIGSRRKCEDYIREGRVAVNGTVIDTNGFKVSPGDEVMFDGGIVSCEGKKIYLALNKPAGYLCSQKDSQGRPLARELFEKEISERLFHVGRSHFLHE